MSARERRTLTVANVVILVFMIICLRSGWSRSPHSLVWNYAFWILMLASSLVSLRRTRNVPAPDTLTKLFPNSFQPSPEKQ